MDAFQLAVAHNSWATRRLLEFCAGLDPHLLEQSVPGTYGGARATLAHILIAEHGYLTALGGGFGEDLGPPAQLPLQRQLELAGRLAAAWEELLAGPVEAEREFTGPRGTASDGVVLVQLVHHGSDHRAHVATTLTTLGVEVPVLDVWVFGAETGRVRRAAAAGPG